MAHDGRRIRQVSSPACALTVCAAALILLIVAVTPAHAQVRQKQVLVLHSTGREAQVVVVAEREVPPLLEAGLGSGIDYYSEYIDRGRFPSPEYRTAFRNFLRTKYSGQKFDLVIAMQDLALGFIAENRDFLFPNTPIVFLSYNERVQRLPNSTGVLVPVNLRSTVMLALTLQPDTRHVFVVSGADDGAREYAQLAAEQLHPLDSEVEITYLTGLSTRDLEARMRTLPPHSIVYFTVMSRDADGQIIQPLAYLERLTSIANAPVYSWVDSVMDRGVVGGSLRGQKEQAVALAGIAVRVLRGEPADGIALQTRDFATNQVDWREIQRFGIRPDRIPAGTVIKFKEPTVWDRYRWYIVAAAVVVLAQAALIVLLWVQARRRRLAEEHARGSEAALRSSHDRIRDLGARLLSAQEVERSRIARELHDDISQQLALLSIDLELLADQAGHSSAALAHGAMNRAQDVARSVHDLSHRLHPAKLRLIGLVAGIQGLRHELSSTDLEVTFTHERVPATLPSDLTLCLFRVVQEALQNAMKYSEARRVHIALNGTPEVLLLTISDDGIGFDVATAWGRGLGLISMSERLEALGGTMQVESKRGAGTQLRIAAPLTAHAQAVDHHHATPIQIPTRGVPLASA